MRIAHYFAMARRDARLGQREVADALGITIHTLSRYENGKSAIPEETTRQLASLYQVELDGWRTDAEREAGDELRLPQQAKEIDRTATFAKSDPRYWSARWDQAVSSLRSVLREHEALADEMRDEVWKPFRTPAVSKRLKHPAVFETELGALPDAPPGQTEEDGGEAERRARESG